MEESNELSGACSKKGYTEWHMSNRRREGGGVRKTALEMAGVCRYSAAAEGKQIRCTPTGGITT